MILELFVVFVVLALIAIGLGYFTGDDFHAFIGLFFLFLLSTVLVSGSLQVRHGDTAFTNASINTTVTTYDYASVNDSYTKNFGIFLGIAAGFGMAMSFYNYRRKKKKEAL